MLTNGFVEKNGSTDALVEPFGGHYHFTIIASRLSSFGNPQFCKSFVAGWITFIHCQQTFVVGNHRFGGVHQFLYIHFELYLVDRLFYMFSGRNNVQRNGSVFQHILSFTSQNDIFQPFTTVRPHNNQVHIHFFGGF